MTENNVLSIAGLDPSGGAGLLADIKTFHQMRVNGFGVASALTYQTDDRFFGLKWISQKEVLQQLEPLLGHYSIGAVKFGLISSLEQLNMLVTVIRKSQPESKIIWDPVLKATAGYTFHLILEKEELKNALRQVDCITPNLEEAHVMATALGISDIEKLKDETNVILKDGHGSGSIATDRLVQAKKETVEINNPRLKGKSIHGSGCVFSAALAASVSKGARIEEAFSRANAYVHQLLSVTDTRLGKHHLLEL